MAIPGGHNYTVLPIGQGGDVQSFSPFGAAQVAEATLLVGGNHQAGSFNSIIWEQFVTNGGEVVAEEGLAILRTNTASDGSAIVRSRRIARFLTGINNYYGAGIRTPDPRAPNCIRRWGAFDDQNGVFFQLQDGQLLIGIRKGGVDTLALPNLPEHEGTLAIDDRFHVYKIVYSAGSAKFYQDQRFAYVHRATMSSLCNTTHFRLTAEIQNLAGRAINTELQVRGSTIHRFGSAVPQSWSYYVANISEVRTLKDQPGTLRRVVFGRPSGGTPAITIYDGLSTSAPVLASLGAKDWMGVLDLGLDFDTGLTYQTPANPGHLVIVYD